MHSPIFHFVFTSTASIVKTFWSFVPSHFSHWFTFTDVTDNIMRISLRTIRVQRSVRDTQLHQMVIDLPKSTVNLTYCRVDTIADENIFRLTNFTGYKIWTAFLRSLKIHKKRAQAPQQQELLMPDKLFHVFIKGF